MGITILGGSDKWKFGSVTSYGIHQTCTMDGGCGYTTYTILTTQLWPALSEVEVHSNHPDLAQHLWCVCVCVCVCVWGGEGGEGTLHHSSAILHEHKMPLCQSHQILLVFLLLLHEAQTIWNSVGKCRFKKMKEWQILPKGGSQHLSTKMRSSNVCTAHCLHLVSI